MFSLQNKTAIITGSSSGIGKAIAELFAEQGATVYGIDQNNPGENNSIQFISCDVQDRDEVNDAIKSIINKQGRIDILVNNAGIAHVGNAETTRPEDIERLFAVNVKGVYNFLHACIPFMKEKGGVILNMASIASSVGITDRFAYSMTKGAVVGMTLSVARDYIGHKIRCNCISPARVHTPFVDGFIARNYPGKEKEMFEKLSKGQPIGRMADPKEIAYLALYLCSDESSFITGCDYPIDGGFIKLNN